MSFPVPTKYLLNNSQNAARIVYNNGDEVEGLPYEVDLSGAVIKQYRFTPDHNIKAPESFQIQLAPVRNCIICIFAITPVTPDEIDTVIIGASRGFYSSRSSYSSFGLSPNESVGGLSAGEVGSYDRDTGLYSIPTGGSAILKAGITYQILQLKLPEDP